MAKQELPKEPVVIGHRGFGRTVKPREPLTHSFVENTRASFLAAHEAGAAWVELDVIATEDETVLLWHNHFLEGAPIHRVPLARLASDGVEHFEELTRDLPPGLGVNVEVKPMPLVRGKRHGEDFILEQAAAMAEARPVLWSSFDPVIAGRGKEANLNTAWVTRPGYPLHEAAMAALNLKTDALMVHGPGTLETGKAEELALGWELTHAAGLPVWCWDVTPSEVARLACDGVRGFCTDDVAEVVDILNRGTMGS